MFSVMSIKSRFLAKSKIEDPVYSRLFEQILHLLLILFLTSYVLFFISQTPGRSGSVKVSAA